MIQLLALMEAMRSDGWCVTLKCLPKEMSYVIEGARSEYDAPSEDREIGKGMWCCETTDMLYLKNPNARYRGSPFALRPTAEEAVAEVHRIITSQKQPKETHAHIPPRT